MSTLESEPKNDIFEQKPFLRKVLNNREDFLKNDEHQYYTVSREGRLETQLLALKLDPERKIIARDGGITLGEYIQALSGIKDAKAILPTGTNFVVPNAFCELAEIQQQIHGKEVILFKKEEGMIKANSLEKETKKVLREKSEGFIVDKESVLKGVGKRLYKNECSNRREKLVHWNKGETFPSLGVAHFIWKNNASPFPEFIRYCQKKEIKGIPSWLTVKDEWTDEQKKEIFRNPEKKEALIVFLERTILDQTMFVAERLNTFVESSRLKKQPELKVKVDNMLQNEYGYYALYDFVNFKGEGGCSWVLRNMTTNGEGKDGVCDFARAAKKYLWKRVEKASPKKKEIVKGWYNGGWSTRIDSYVQAFDPSTKETRKNKQEEGLLVKAGHSSYFIKSGDVMGKIARNHGVTLADIRKSNPGKNLDRVNIGDQFFIPKKQFSQRED